MRLARIRVELKLNEFYDNVFLSLKISWAHWSPELIVRGINSEGKKKKERIPASIQGIAESRPQPPENQLLVSRLKRFVWSIFIKEYKCTSQRWPFTFITVQIQYLAWPNLLDEVYALIYGNICDIQRAALPS